MLELKSYQSAGVEFCLSAASETKSARRTRWLGDDPGLGKTVQGAVVLREAFARELATCAIVIAPAGLLRVWRRELLRWAPRVRVLLPASSAKLRAPEPGEVLVMSYDAFAVLVTEEREGEAQTERLAALSSLQNLLAGTWLVADELHYIRGKASDRSLCFEHLRELVHRRRGVCIGLSGSIMPNTPLDLWIALTRFGIAQLVFPRGITEWAEHFGGHYDRRSRRWHFAKHPPGGSILPRLHGSGLILRRTSEEVGNELPPVVYAVTKCSVPDELVTMSRTLIAEALTGDRALAFEQSSGEDIDLLNLEKALDFGELSRLRKESAAAKIPTMLRRLDELERDREGDPIVVCSDHLEPIARLKSRPGWAVITGAETKTTRDRIITRFQLGELLGVGLTSAGREGLTLTRSNYLLRVSTSWSAENEKQFAGRLVRFGQARTVTIETLVAEHPIEKMVYRKLAEKQVRGLETFALA